jgi:HlyD family secretion protein
MDVKKSDEVSSGSAIATLITDSKFAEISLNEVDIAKVKVGQKATLTFDAIDNLSITGQVTETDIVGAVSQGVVTYNVKIGFDTQDDRVRSGMSVSADIVTDIKQDILIAPSGAVKSQGETNYVEIVDREAEVTTGNQGVVLDLSPRNQEVVVGLSDDTSTEIISGLEEGDKIITRTITTSSTKTTTISSAPSLFGSGGSRPSALPH